MFSEEVPSTDAKHLREANMSRSGYRDEKPPKYAVNADANGVRSLDELCETSQANAMQCKQKICA